MSKKNIDDPHQIKDPYLLFGCSRKTICDRPSGYLDGHYRFFDNIQLYFVNIYIVYGWLQKVFQDNLLCKLMLKLMRITSVSGSRHKFDTSARFELKQ